MATLGTPEIPCQDPLSHERYPHLFQGILNLALSTSALATLLKNGEDIPLDISMFAGIAELLDLIGDALIERAAEGLAIAGLDQA